MISDSTITNTTFDYDVTQLNVQDATIDRCSFKGLINNASISGNLTKCQFEGLSDEIVITGPLNDMTIQSDITPYSANYVQDDVVITDYNEIESLIISSEVVPRLAESLHKECFILIKDGKQIFIVQLSTDDNTPKGVILMWSGNIDDVPSGYGVCDGRTIDGVQMPDLSGRFIKMIESGDPVGPVDNNDTEVVNGEQTNRIKLSENHLPKHKHELSGITLEDASTDSVDVSSGSSISYASGDSSFTPDSVSVSSEDHTHTVSSGAKTGDGNFQNDSFNIAPQAYALIFIMKL